MAVLKNLAPELRVLLGVDVQIPSFEPGRRVPVALARGEVEQVVLAVALRMGRYEAGGSCLRIVADRIVLSGSDAARLGLVAGEFGFLRFAAPVTGHLRASAVAVAGESRTASLGGEILRILAARRIGAVRVESMPGGGSSATIYLLAAP